jgi:Alpha/beta hydrolase domain
MPEVLCVSKHVRIILAAAFVALMTQPAIAATTVPNPTVIGPVAQTAAPGDASHNYIFFSSNHDLAGHGYVEEEFFIQGQATRYATPNQTNPDSSSLGTVISTNNAYKTRMVVRRPADPSKFNGVVLVEWYNVTNNFDAENVWFFNWENIMRSGYVWVGVSAQRVGVAALKTWSPSRYGSLDVMVGGTVTDDSLSYDIFSQAGKAIDSPSGIDPLHGLVPKTIIATGESQSAQRLSAYTNSIQPLANLYDGIVALSTLGNRIRVDTSVPFFKLNTEFDVLSSEANVRQNDNNVFRTWEVAGTSHVDQHLRNSREPLELRDNGVSSEAVGLDPPPPNGCNVKPVGTRVPTTYVLSSAFDKTVKWIQNGTLPPAAPRITITTFGSPSVPLRNSLGLAQGGIQLSQVVVPTRINVGLNSGPGACVRWGYSVPIDAAMLATMYPTPVSYYGVVGQVDKANLIAGYILMPDMARDLGAAVGGDISGLYEGP